MKWDVICYNIEKIVKNNLEEKAIDLINTFALEREKIIKNPNYQTFSQWCPKEDLEDESLEAIRRDQYESMMEIDKRKWPYRIKHTYYLTAEQVLYGFFRRRPAYMLVFISRQEGLL
ncbi:hypothetical protein B5M19_04085 [Mesomycoplasma hyopneumoniae]|uniref:hypothetical protein n=1 Tax=Mesomycoplasma hyopneumoniae TaxID=2099 RepID=UPI000B540BF7|nr:hypothetical protein [Mesomycoplasma hyopneumoniae]OWY73539.1 hypothetical protein B5M19_04085 [Mesomycoplasma hyopneumoniae]